MPNSILRFSISGSLSTTDSFEILLTNVVLALPSGLPGYKFLCFFNQLVEFIEVFLISFDEEITNDTAVALAHPLTP